MKRTLVAATLTVVFVLALATPAFAMTHDATYEWDGTADMERQVGHLCNTGAEQKVAISGEGTMERVSSAVMSAGKLTVDETSDFVTADDATENLTVTSVIELCAPPKTEVTPTDYVYGDPTQFTYAEGEDEFDIEDAWFTDVGTTEKLDPWDYYEGNMAPETLTEALLACEQLSDEDEAEVLAADAAGDDAALQTLAYKYFGEEGFKLYDHNELTDQIWAVQVEANPGMSGNVHQDFEAAYGGANYHAFDDEDGAPAAADLLADEFGFVAAPTIHDPYAPARGSDYVGDYFHMDQMARTSDGELKRFIDISEPYDGAYLMEDFEVEGEVDVEEAFTMDRVAPGEDIEVVWYDLF